MGMYRRILVAIGRGPMSNTVAAFRPWEIPILREVHGGGNAIVVKDEEQLVRAKQMGMMELEEFDPTEENLQIEYDRLCNLYGFHTEVKQFNCERVYGIYEDGKFSAAVRQACRVTLVQNSREPIKNVEPVYVEPPPKLHKTVEELQSECEELGIEWAPGMSVRVLQALVDDALDPPGSFVEEVDPNPMAASG